jgi:GNAT superfamily N-acetyltransferase
MNAPGTRGYTFRTTGYGGFEGDILRLRNANRAQARSSDYLAWRYAGLRGAPDPLVYWIRDAADRPIGMASMIFRAFCIDGQMRWVAVLGDISLDAEQRGRGLGRSLLQYVTDSLGHSHPETLALVIPNQAAQQALTAIGWTKAGRLVPHVLLLNPQAKLRELLRSTWLAKVLAPLARLWVTIAVKANRRPGYSLRLDGSPDESFDMLWRSLDKSNLAIGDRGIGALQWRYVAHPGGRFRFAKLERLGRLAGYLAYELQETSRDCVVHDLVVREPDDVGRMLALFVAHLSATGAADSVRLVLNDGHPYRRRLRRLGFVARKESAAFLLHGARAQAALGGSTWFLTHGDKDI